ncbi:MAG: PLP-dependent aminotransferase family protein, partial [Acidimicrobiales bacterium]
TFPGVLALLRHRGRRVAGIPSDANGVKPEGLEEMIRQQGPALVYLVPTCQNPTGSILPTGRRQRIAGIISRTGTPLVEDLSLTDVILSDATIPAPIASHAPEAPIISIGSANKPLWMGLRVGWMRLPDAWGEELLTTKTLADLGTPVLAQRLLLTLVPVLDQARSETRDTLNANMNATLEELNAQLPDWEAHVPQGGSNLWLRLPAARSDALVHAALRHGLQLVSGRAFSPENLCADRLRLPFTLPPATMREAVRRLALAWNEVRQLEPAATRVQQMVVV